MVGFSNAPSRLVPEHSEWYNQWNTIHCYFLGYLHGYSNERRWKQHSNAHHPSERYCSFDDYVLSKFTCVDKGNNDDNSYANNERRYAHIVVGVSIAPSRTVFLNFNRCNQWNANSNYLLSNLHNHGEQQRR
jgi:hypothetical protein